IPGQRRIRDARSRGGGRSGGPRCPGARMLDVVQAGRSIGRADLSCGARRAVARRVSETEAASPLPNPTQPVRRRLFIATVLAGSFLLFLVQPLVARMALPQLGGAPNVWNSAMLVYQALLLAGYGYAHWLGGMRVRRQTTIHLALLALAVLWLPISLADL